MFTPDAPQAMTQDGQQGRSVVWSFPGDGCGFGFTPSNAPEPITCTYSPATSRAGVHVLFCGCVRSWPRIAGEDAQSPAAWLFKFYDMIRCVGTHRGGSDVGVMSPHQAHDEA